MLSLIALAALAPHTFVAEGEHFLLDGKPFTIRSGEMHYPRIPRAYWRDRLQKAKAMGLNTITTYIFWNAHEETPGKFDFRGNNDVAAFAREVKRQGMFLIVRPGPYVCSEWEWGGFPWWLAKTPAVDVRQDNPRFLEYAGRYLKAVGKQLAPLTLKHGGPIVLCQVENEYGSFGQDHAYMAKILDLTKAAGFDCQLYTADGSADYMLRGGTLPGLPSAINFGGGAPGEFANLAKYRPGGPKMNGEFWCGWFDHWRDDHNTTSAESQAGDLKWMLDRDISFSLYMFHGGTSFGWMAGANSGGKGFEPDTTSYDYDAPVAEDGRLTPKYFAFRNEIAKHLAPGEKLPEPPVGPKTTTVPRFELSESANVFSNLPKPIVAPEPKSFEDLDQPYGFVLYRTKVAAAKKGTLTIDRLQDRAMIYINGQLSATLERQKGEKSAELNVPAGATLDLLVENQGRVNFSRALLNERKGIRSATLAGDALTGWQMYRLPFDAPGRMAFGADARTAGPVVRRGAFELERTADTHLDLRGWGKGNVWVNGHHLGRYWHVGPQQSLYLPATFLRTGRNEVIVLDLEPTRTRSLQGIADPIFSKG